MRATLWRRAEEWLHKFSLDESALIYMRTKGHFRNNLFVGLRRIRVGKMGERLASLQHELQFAVGVQFVW
jgi:hypothetical protein